MQHVKMREMHTRIGMFDTQCIAFASLSFLIIKSYLRTSVLLSTSVPFIPIMLLPLLRQSLVVNHPQLLSGNCLVR